MYQNRVNGYSPSSVASEMLFGTFSLQGNLVSHGGFSFLGGTLTTDGSVNSSITVDSGNLFWLNGGELDITQNGNGPNPAAVGYLLVNGDFRADTGTIVDNVDTSNNQHQSGKFFVNGNATLAADAIFSSRDLNPNPGVANWDWGLFQYTGTLTGTFGFNLPPGWTATWLPQIGILDIHEP